MARHGDVASAWQHLGVRCCTYTNGDVVRDNIFGVRCALINFNSILRLNEASFMYKDLYVSANSNAKQLTLTSETWYH